MKRTYFKGIEIVRLAMAGVPRDEIERATGANHRSVIVVLSYARKRGLPIPKLPTGAKPWRRLEVAELIHLTPKMIAERLGINTANVRVQLAKLRADGVDIPYRRVPSAKFRDAMANRSPRT